MRPAGNSEAGKYSPSIADDRRRDGCTDHGLADWGTVLLDDDS